MNSISFLKRGILALSISLISQGGYAQAPAPESLDQVRAALATLVGPRANDSKITESPMQGVYQADLGDRIVFVSKVGKHMILGDVFDTERKVSLSEELKQVKIQSVIGSMDEADMIVFQPSNGQKAKRTVTVYTDVDCPYCRKLHKEVPKLLDAGVKVRYLWFPRSGLGTPSYDKAVSIWCADDQVAAMDDAKLNNKIVAAKCDPNPVAAQYKSGSLVGVRGTPSIVVDDGTVIGGYLPAKQLLANLGLTQ